MNIIGVDCWRLIYGRLDNIDLVNFVCAVNYNDKDFGYSKFISERELKGIEDLQTLHTRLVLRAPNNTIDVRMLIDRCCRIKNKSVYCKNSESYQTLVYLERNLIRYLKQIAEEIKDKIRREFWSLDSEARYAQFKLL